jgi:trans-aconitate methyltransferase
MTETPGRRLFDAYATRYDTELNKALAISGETTAYFAHERVRWLARRLTRYRGVVRQVMDFGCGTGSSVPVLVEALGATSGVGIDSSTGLLETARRAHQSERVRFMSLDEWTPCGEIDLAYCNGVFHHIPKADRAGALRYIYRALRPGAVFSFWENNPWNPGTRYVMRQTPFDRDAEPLSPITARRLLKAGGFRPLETTFIFVFPRLLRRLRPVEPFLSRVPLGAQYHILCSRPD